MMTQNQLNQLRIIIYDIAFCEGTNPGRIYLNIKKDYCFSSLDELDMEQGQKIIEILSTQRICPLKKRF